MTAETFRTIETLRDGRRIVLRAQRPTDGEAFRQALSQLGDESIYLRFFGPRREFSAKEAEAFLNIDFVTHVALVAEPEPGGAIIGGGRFVLIDSGRAEIAFAVIDEYQGYGVGSRLLRHLTALAREAGLREFVAEVLAGNRPMLKAFEKSGLPMRTTREANIVHVTLALT